MENTENTTEVTNKTMEIKENQYMNLKISMGVLGDLEVLVFQNNKKEKAVDPDFKISVKQGAGGLKPCGVGWINTKKGDNDANTAFDKVSKR